MKKISYLFCSAVATALVSVCFANAEITPFKDFQVKKTRHEIPAGYTQMNPVGTKMAGPRDADGLRKEVSQSQTTTVLFEDFSNVPDGEFVQTGKIGMRAVTPIANYDCGKFMNPSYTPGSGQWYGEWVFAGTGGTVIVQPYNPQSKGCLQFPLGDYSGDLVLTVRLRALPAFWGADNEVGYVTSAGRGANVMCFATLGGYGSNDPADCELGRAADLCKIYQKEGWVEARLTFRNNSACADGSIILFLSEACEIDWIKVEDTGTYLAAPAVGGVTDFQEDQFSIKWDPVRRAFNYYIDFFYAKWLAESGVDINYDFESGIPDDFTAGGAAGAPGEAPDGSAGIRVADGEDNSFVTPTYLSFLQACGVDFIFHQTMDDSELEDMPEPPALHIDGLTEEGWRPVTVAEIDGYWTPGNKYLKGSLDGDKFAGQYKALRFYSKNTDDENYFVIDNVSPFAPRPYELARVIDEDPDHNHCQVDMDSYQPYIDMGAMSEEEALEQINSPFNFWWNTDTRDPEAYTFTDCVESDREYFYRVRSHRLEVSGENTFVGEEIHHALGVASPQLQDAEDFTDDSYAAVWKDVAKAQNYIVTNYVATEIDKDQKDYTVFSEEFSNISGPSGVDAYEPVSGDIDTDMPGWHGEDLAVGDNAVGSVDGGILVSPEIGVVGQGSHPYYVYFEAEGYSGEALVVQFNGLQTYVLAPFEEDGTVAGTITVNQPVEGESISFYTYNGYPFGIKALEVTQDIDKGAIVREFESSQVIPAGVAKATFCGLDKDRKYAYKVVSVYDFEQQRVRSLPNGLYAVVDMAEGTTSRWSKVDNIADEDVVVVARYTVDGLEVPESHKGLVIERLSNGKTRKVVRR